ncbi:hypothetical protein CTZ27_11620 [Streptomyces griseocarneus]|nr:hypothetical protein CTZ27_11620 [Streptomyces griseocarneus]
MDIAELLGVSLPTVDRWKRRYTEYGLAGLEGNRPGGAREQVPTRVRARVVALTRMTPPDGTGFSHRSTRFTRNAFSSSDCALLVHRVRAATGAARSEAHSRAEA